ncbi:MAG: LysR family transcriptional regulator [Caldimonas sp.]
MASRISTKPRSPRAVAARVAPCLQLRIRVRLGDVVAIGPGKISLLEAVREHGSISAGARALGMSYRRAWLLLDELNASLSTPAMVTSQGGRSGGGASLTEGGEALVALYRRIETEALAATKRDTARMLRLLARRG